jgi:hypothetical protein
MVVFFLIGYWVVDYFWPKKKPIEKPGGEPDDKS